MEILKERREEQQRRIKLAKEFIDQVAKKLGPITAVIIGSTSRGDFNKWSDIDVIIISENLPENPLKRFDKLTPHIRPGIEPIPLKPADATRLARKKAPVTKEIINGIILRDDLKIIQKLRNIYTTSKQ